MPAVLKEEPQARVAGVRPREQEGEGVGGEAQGIMAGARLTSRLVVYSLAFTLRRWKG